MRTTVITLRWTARILSCALLGLGLVFLFGHLFGDAGRATRPLGPMDYAAMSSMALAFLGLAVAWKRELVGSLLTLAGMAVLVALNWRILGSLLGLLPLNAVMFLIVWWLDRGGRWSRRRTGAVTAPVS